LTAIRIPKVETVDAAGKRESIWHRAELRRSPSSSRPAELFKARDDPGLGSDLPVSNPGVWLGSGAGWAYHSHNLAQEVRRARDFLTSSFVFIDILALFRRFLVAPTFRSALCPGSSAMLT